MSNELNNGVDSMLKKQRIESGDRLKQCRMKAGISQKDFAKKSNYSVQQICYIEKGKRGMSEESARIFGKILNVRPEYLLVKDDAETINDYMEKEVKKHFSSLSKESLTIEYLDRYINNVCDSVYYKFNGCDTKYHLYSEGLSGGMHSPVWILKEKDSSERIILLESIHISLDSSEIELSFEEYYLLLESIGDYIKFRLSNLKKERDTADKCREMLNSITCGPGQENESRLVNLFGTNIGRAKKYAEDFLKTAFLDEDNETDHEPESEQ